MVASFVAMVARVGCGASPARADLFGGDDVILSGILTQAINELSTLGSMLSSLTTEVGLVRTELSQLDPRSYQALYDLVDDLSLGTNALTQGLRSVGYTLSAVNAQFGKTFPSSMTSLPLSQFDRLYGQWATEVLAASQVAERAQTGITSLANDARAAHAILAQSAASSGEVGQLQSVVQMLSLMQAQNSQLVQTLATTGRVLASSSAVAASERQLSREKKKRALANYTFRGSPVPPMKMP